MTTRMTPAEAARAARMFEETTAADLTPAPRRGRPRLAEDQQSVKAQAWMPKPLYDRLERKARAQGTSVSALIREAAARV